MKVALVTGAGKGLGFEWCKQLGKQGYHVILTARKQDQAATAATALQEDELTIIPKAMDVTDKSTIQAVVQWVGREYGQLDLLINNAGINSGTRAKGDRELQQKNLSLEHLDGYEVLNMLNINAIAPIMVARNFAPLLSKGARPKIIHIGSWLGSITIKQTGGNYSYAVSKSALNMMNRALAFDLKEQGIVSVVVNPGWVATDMGGAKAKFTPAESVQQLLQNVVDAVTIEHTGTFLNHDGTVHPY